MSIAIRSFPVVLRACTMSAALAAILGAGVAVASAQTSQSETAAPAAPQGQTAVAPALNLKFVTADPMAYAISSSSSSSSSLDSDADGTATLATVTADPLHLNAMQYGGRQRYGRPRYRGGNTNADGSNKWIFYGGAGLAQPSGNTWKYFTPSWGVQIGGGRQFSSHFAVPIEFDYDAMGLSRQAISNEAYIYTGDPNAADNGIDANAHIWSFSIDPTYTIFGNGASDTWGAYVLADVGFYHKVTNLTSPEEVYDPIYGLYEVNANFAHYTSNAPGFGAGFGATYKFSHFSNERFYGEVRYVFVDNSQRTGYTATEAANSVPYGGSDFFPANSNRTTYFPIKFGIRF